MKEKCNYCGELIDGEIKWVVNLDITDGHHVPWHVGCP